MNKNSIKIIGLKEHLKSESVNLQKSDGLRFVSIIEVEREDEFLQKLLGSKKYRIEVTATEISKFNDAG